MKHLNKYFENSKPITSENNPLSVDNVERSIPIKQELSQDLNENRQNLNNAGIFVNGVDVLNPDRKLGVKTAENKLKGFVGKKAQGIWKGLKGIGEKAKNTIGRIQFERSRDQNIKELRRLGDEVPDNLQTFEEYQEEKRNKANSEPKSESINGIENAESAVQLELDLGMTEAREEVLPEMTTEQRKTFFSKMKGWTKDQVEKYKSLPTKDKIFVAGIAVGCIGAGGFAAVTAAGYGSFALLGMKASVPFFGAIQGVNGVSFGTAAAMAKVYAGGLAAGAFAGSGLTAHSGINYLHNQSQKAKSNEQEAVNGEIIEENNQGPKTNDFAASHQMYGLMEKGFQNQQNPKPKTQTYTSRQTSIFAHLPKNEPTQGNIAQEPAQQFNNPNQVYPLQPVQNIINAERAIQNAVEPVIQSQENLSAQSNQPKQTEKKPSPLYRLKKGFEKVVVVGKEKLANLKELSKLTTENKYQQPLSQDQIKVLVAENNLDPELAESSVSEKDLEVYLAGKEEYYIRDENDDFKPFNKNQIDTMLAKGEITVDRIEQFSSFNFEKAAEQIINDLGDPNNLLAHKINNLVMKKVIEKPELYLMLPIQEKFPNINNPRQILEILNKNNPDSLFSKTGFDSQDYLKSYGEIISSMKTEINDLKREAENAIDEKATELYYELTSINNPKSTSELNNDDIEAVTLRDKNIEISKLPKNVDNSKLIKELNKKYTKIQIKLSEAIEQTQN
jgi:hypothetical protein